MNDASKIEEALADTDAKYAELVRRSTKALGRYEDLQIEHTGQGGPDPRVDEAWAAYKAAEEELNAYLGEKHQDACR